MLTPEEIAKLITEDPDIHEGWDEFGIEDPGIEGAPKGEEWWRGSDRKSALWAFGWLLDNIYRNPHDTEDRAEYAMKVEQCRKIYNELDKGF